MISCCQLWCALSVEFHWLVHMSSTCVPPNLTFRKSSHFLSCRTSVTACYGTHIHRHVLANEERSRKDIVLILPATARRKHPATRIHLSLVTSLVSGRQLAHPGLLKNAIESFIVCQSHSVTSSSISDSPIPSPITSSSSDSPLCSTITPSVFHPGLKPTCFTNPTSP